MKEDSWIDYALAPIVFFLIVLFFAMMIPWHIALEEGKTDKKYIYWLKEVPSMLGNDIRETWRENPLW